MRSIALVAVFVIGCDLMGYNPHVQCIIPGTAIEGEVTPQGGDCFGIKPVNTDTIYTTQKIPADIVNPWAQPYVYRIGAGPGDEIVWPSDFSGPPTGVVIVGTGYSNASQHFSTYESTYQADIEPVFINCAQGGSAIENWIANSSLWTSCISEIEAAGYTANDVGVTLNLIANQVLYPAYPDAGNGVDSLEIQVQNLAALLEAYFPNAINTYTTGEPAHWVASSKCPRICEPVRYETVFGVNRALKALASLKHIHGAYLWSDVDQANASGYLWECSDFNPEGAGCPTVANQHPSNAGREKAAAIYHRFLSIKWPQWYLGQALPTKPPLTFGGG